MPKSGYELLLYDIFGEEEEPNDHILQSIVEDGKEVLFEQAMREALESLPHRKGHKDAAPWNRGKLVLELLYGLEGQQSQTLGEASLHSKFQLTPERIRQLQARAMRQLRHPTRSKRLRQFLPQF